MNNAAKLYAVMKRENPTLAGARQSLELSKNFLAAVPGHLTVLDPMHGDHTEIPFDQVVAMLDLIVAEYEAVECNGGTATPIGFAYRLQAIVCDSTNPVRVMHSDARSTLHNAMCISYPSDFLTLRKG
jgi:hypothetical protein